MHPSCHHIALEEPGRHRGREAHIYLVDKGDALWLCRDGGYERVRDLDASYELARRWPDLSRAIESFARQSRMLGLQGPGLRTDELVARLCQGVERGHLVAIRPGQAAALAADDPLLAQRRLVGEVAAHIRGRLQDGGRQYRLVAGLDLATLPDRNSYEVVARGEALRVLEALMGQASGRADMVSLLGKARDLLSPDWRPPLSPQGIVLLRRVVPVRVASVVPEAALTPSQLRAAMEADKPLEFFARFVDEHGQTVDAFKGQLAHGSDPEVDMAFSGSSFARVGDRKGPRQAGLTVAEEAVADLVRALEQRWKKVRGKADLEWQEKEEALVEVELPAEGPLELELLAGKKHTFMLRPKVALAHLHGMYFDTNKCFLLPSAVPSLRRLVETYAKHEGAEVLIAGHADTAGTEADNLPLSGERADAMRAYLCDDADAWLAWYGNDVPKGKRWGEREDNAMIDALIPRHERPMGRCGRRVRAYQNWHNAKGANEADPTYHKGEGWEKLKADGSMGPKTRRQLIIDYMSLDGTSLPEGTRVVTYGCGELYPLTKEEGTTDQEAQDGKQVRFNRRVELFFFDQPFGILPEVPGVPKGESTASAVLASKGDALYPEWRLRASRRYAITGPERELCLVNELGLPLANRKVRVAVPEQDEVEVISDDEGKIRITVPEGSEFDLIIENIHEGGGGDSLETPSGTHFATGADGPEVES